MADTLSHIEYFNMHGILKRGFLHPGGENATGKLLNRLASLRPEATVLEIGCGIGETALLLLDRYPYRYVGIDASPAMLNRMRIRLLPHAGRSALIECDLLYSALPFESNSVDAIIAESVFEVLTVGNILQECHRALRGGGFLCLNSRMWSDTTTSGERRAANAYTQKLLGVPAAPEEPATIDEWVSLVEKIGFELVTKEKLGATNHDNRENSRRLATFIQILVHPSYVGYWLNNRRVEKKFKHVWDAMESWMIVARKR